VQSTTIGGLILGATGDFAVQKIEAVGLVAISSVAAEKLASGECSETSRCPTNDSPRDTIRSRKSLEINVPILAWFQTEVRDLKSPSS
jgi:hypothetical protein